MIASMCPDPRTVLSRVALALLAGPLLLTAVACTSGHKSATTATPAVRPTAAVATTPAAQTPRSSSTATSAASASDWPMYHRDLARTGVSPGAAWSRVSRAWTSDGLDGDIYAEPLVAGGRVIAATQHNSVYALDAVTGKAIWHADLGAPVPRSALPCGNIDPTGITSTPVIDPAAGLAYVVDFVLPGKHELIALALADGAVRFRRAVDPPGVSPLVHQQRGALALSGGRVYVPYGGLFGDCGDYHGWVVASSADGSGDLLSYQVAAGQRAGIWAPAGPAIDANGDLYVATGNSNARSTVDQGDSVLKLSPSLQLLSSFTPSDWAAHNAADLDLGSITPALVGDGLAVQGGKPGVAYLLRMSALGGIGGQIASARVCNGAYGGAAVLGADVFLPCRDGIAAVRVDAAAPGISVIWRGPRFDAGPPIVAGGILWAVDVGAGVLYGFDPATGATRVREQLGSVAHFSTPASDGARLYAAADRTIVAFVGE
jgi:outer membrane protein assembly factor BamB